MYYDDGLLNREWFSTLIEAKTLTEEWRREYNQFRPHSAPGQRPPSPEAILLDDAFELWLRGWPKDRGLVNDAVLEERGMGDKVEE